jgi:hypothetical protein
MISKPAADKVAGHHVTGTMLSFHGNPAVTS